METWEGRTFLTFDIDWAHDAVIADSIDLVEAAGVPATWFVTHDTPLLDRLRANPMFELGLHPNFLPLLLHGSREKGGSAAEVLDSLLAIVPEARAVRAHSLVQSGRLTEIYKERNLTHEASMFIAAPSMALEPWLDWFGITRVPYGWEDDFWCDRGRPPRNRPERGLECVSFHPIHVFLNSETLDRYGEARADFDHPERLVTRRFSGEGVRTELLSLLGSAKDETS